MENIIKFSYNWNNKLDCQAFTTFRPANSRYKRGEKYKVYFKEKFLYEAQIIDIKKLRLKEVNDYISYLDTGYSVNEFVEIVRKMYQNADNLLFFWILLKRVQEG